MLFAFKTLRLSKQISFFCGFNSIRSLTSLQNAPNFSYVPYRAFASQWDLLNRRSFHRGSESYSQEKCQIYAGNISFNTTEKEIRDFFQRFGRFTRFSLLRSPDGSFKGKAFITYDNPESAELACKENSKLFNGRNIEISLDADRSKEKAKIESLSKSNDCIIYIKNLPGSIGVDSLKEKFGKFGKILRVSVRDRNKPDLPPGIAFITYESPEMAKAAIEGMNGKALGLKTISVTVKDEKNKSRDNLIHVGDLPGLITREELNTLFDHCGEIEEITIKEDGVGYAFIKFKYPQGFENALKMNEHEYKGYPIQVAPAGTKKSDEDKSKPSRRSLSSIFIPKILPGLTISGLKEFFSQYGLVSFVAIPSLQSGRLLGHAFVQFNDIDVAQKLIEAGEVIYEGQELIISKPPKLTNKNEK